MTTNIPYPVAKHEFVQAKVTNVAGTTFKFLQNEFLRGKKIVGLANHGKSYLTTCPDQSAIVADALAMGQGFLTLKTTKGVEELNKIPLYLLTPGVTSSGTYEKMFPIDQLIIDWENSYITMANGNVLTLNTSFLISVFYIDENMTCPPSK